MNTIFKPFIFNILLTISIAILFAQISGYFIKSSPAVYIQTVEDKNNPKFNISSAMNLSNKIVIKKKIEKKKVQTQRVFLLKDFTISGIILDGKSSMVIIRDKNGGNFLQLNSSYKGYKFIEVFPKKAKFSKGGNIYFSFLTPDDEKNFNASAEKNANKKVVPKKTKREKITGTISQNMFNDIKYKNGKYFIPKDIITEYSSLNRIFSGISIQAYSINGHIKYKIRYVSPNSIFSIMGLKKNDFIIQVNNNDFKSISEPLKYFQNLKNIESLSLTIERNNKKKELKYEIY